MLFLKITLIALGALVPLWLSTRRARAQFRQRFGRTPTARELDSLGAWLQEPPPEPPHTAPSPPAETSPRTSFGRDGGA